MIIEAITKSSQDKVLFDDMSIVSIQEHNKNGTSFWLYSKESPIIVTMPFDEAQNIFIESKKRDRITGNPIPKSEQKKFKTIEVGEYRFKLDIRVYEYEDGLSSSLQLYANFLVKNDLIKQFVEYVVGVEQYCEYSWNKYEGQIIIGKMFDAEIIREQVEQKIVECLSTISDNS